MKLRQKTLAYSSPPKPVGKGPNLKRKTPCLPFRHAPTISYLIEQGNRKQNEKGREASNSVCAACHTTQFFTQGQWQAYETNSKSGAQWDWLHFSDARSPRRFVAVTFFLHGSQLFCNFFCSNIPTRKFVLKPEIEIVVYISLVSPNRDALVEAPLRGDDGLAERADHLPERARLQGARNK